MHFGGQPILPAVKQMRDYEKLLESPYSCLLILDIHIAQLKPVSELAQKYKKRVFFHADMIHGLQSDAYGAEFLCQEFRPAGLLSTKTSVILKAKEKGVLAIQRMFVIDSGALTTSFTVLAKTKPDYLEVLPAPMLGTMRELTQATNTIPILAGGFIRTVDDVETALQLGAVTVTTSDRMLWKHFEGRTHSGGDISG